MKLHTSHPDLTAFALGELSDADAKKVEAYLHENPEAKILVEEIKATASLIEGELKSEPLQSLTPEQSDRLHKRFSKTNFLFFNLSWLKMTGAATLALICLAVVGVRNYLQQNQIQNPIQVANESEHKFTVPAEKFKSGSIGDPAPNAQNALSVNSSEGAGNSATLAFKDKPHKLSEESQSFTSYTNSEAFKNRGSGSLSEIPSGQFLLLA